MGRSPPKICRSLRLGGQNNVEVAGTLALTAGKCLQAGNSAQKKALIIGSLIDCWTCDVVYNSGNSVLNFTGVDGTNCRGGYVFDRSAQIV